MTDFCYAEIDSNGIVQRVIVASSVTWVRDNLPTDGTWERCTKDTSSSQYPGQGWSYDEGYDRFIPPGWSYDPTHDVTVPPGWEVDPQTGIPYDPNEEQP